MKITAGYTLIGIQIIIFIFFLFYAITSIMNIKETNAKLIVTNHPLKQTSYIKAANNEIIYALSDGQNRQSISLKEINPILGKIFIEMEDQQFYKHNGVNLIGISRALFTNINKKGIKEGGSTITQQVAKNVFLTNERTLNRKLKELIYTLKLEHHYSKDEILALYLNSIYFHNGNYGIETASQSYFSKKTSELSLAQLAFLAAIPSNPERYNPLKNFHETKSRQTLILKRIYDKGLIKKADYDKAIKEKITLKHKTNKLLYPDYASYTLEEFNQLVGQHYGLTDKKKIGEKAEALLQSGITIHTALDQSLQRDTKKAMNNGTLPKDVEGAMVIANHKNNTIEAVIGGKDYQPFGFNRAYQAYRQTGSTIKPLLVFAPYIDVTGSNANTIVDANNVCIKDYCPKNATRLEYGKVTLQNALEQSHNTPAVRMLNEIGVEKGFSYLDKFNFTQIVEKDIGLAAALGGFTYGISTVEMTQAYTVFSHDGEYIPPRAITKVTDKDGNILLQWKDTKVRVWSKQTNDIMRDMLQAVVKNGTAKSLNDLPYSYFGSKTGTTNNRNDYWFFGITPTHTTGFWVGYDKPRELPRIPYLSVYEQIANTNKKLRP